MRHPPSLEFRFITRQGIFQELKSRACFNILATQFQIHIGIGQRPVLVVLSADFFIILRNKYIALDATAQCHL